MRSLGLVATALAFSACGGQAPKADDPDGVEGDISEDCKLPPIGASGVPEPSGSAGGLTVLDWAGFKGAVSYTFDDTNSSQIEHYTELNGLGVPLTFYLITGKSEAQNPIWATALEDGHELGNHTKTHRAAATAEDIDAATTFLEEKYGVEVVTMAAPMGDPSYAPFAEDRFLINRGVSNSLIAPNGSANPFNLPCYVPPAGAAASVFDTQIDSARDGGGWRVILVHGFTGGSDGAYQPVDIEEFLSGVNHAKSFGDLWIDTVARIGAYFRGQKAFLAAAPASSGSKTTYKWSLPAHFPKGQCLRVTVDGGTLTQKGQTLPWNDHGYYEVSLDVGSLSLE